MTDKKKTPQNSTKKNIKKNTGKNTGKKPFNKAALDPDKVQRKASDPKASVWLTANAGTGKTKVLTDRVLRLLLEGQAPEDILCVTFTTAAAALMQQRIRQELGAWTTCSDYLLDKQLKKLVGRKPDVALRNHARQLFTRFLEAPDGIKIQTIHSFSQSLIERFPVESKVPPSFKVMDAEDSYGLLRAAQAHILNVVQDDPKTDLAKAVRLITPEVGETEFVNLISGMVQNRKTFRQTLEKHGGLSSTIDAVYNYLNAPYGMRAVDFKYQIGDSTRAPLDGGPNIEMLKQAAFILENGTKTDRAKAEILRPWLEANPDERALMADEYKSVFLTATGSMRKRLTTKQAIDAQDILEHEALRLQNIIESLKTAQVAQGTEALLTLGDAVLTEYESRKTELNYLDYDDLIDKTASLLQDPQHAKWVLEKISGDLHHVLVDEAQDTSPEQWSIVEGLMKALFENTNAKEMASSPQTLFVVGDDKQSIFSFQGADPIEFERRKAFFKKMVKKAGGTWRDVDMDITFRSSQAILDAVDAVFARPEARDGLIADDTKPVKHQSFRQGQAGYVEINSPRYGREKEVIKPWALPDEMKDVQDVSLDLAEEIADRIQEMLETGDKLESRDRAITPNDIMILVRRRSGFVDHMVRALKKRDIPVSGVDRMLLSKQIAVRDLLALGDVLLMPSDDFKLAVVLKTPLLGLTDQQLEDIAQGREGSLWDALQEKATSTDKKDRIYKKAYDYLVKQQAQMNAQTPYKFYSDILMKSCPASEKSGLSAIYKRLGREAEDPMVEFLNALERFEKDNPPSLQSFIQWLYAGEAEIKREINLNAAEPRVSIMTVHGAKGLEAPIVILPDTTGVPADNVMARPRLLWPHGARDVPLWVPSTSLENQAFKHEKQLLEDARDHEFKRLLYVAMTRAADRLYVYGSQNKKQLRDLSWHDLISKGMQAGLEGQLKIEPVPGLKTEETPGLRMIYKTEQTAKPRAEETVDFKTRKQTVLPEWARVAPKPSEDPNPKFIPSHALAFDKNAKNPEENVNANDNDNDNVPSGKSSPLSPKTEDSFDVFERGQMTHNLLEFVPNIAADKRDAVMAQYFKSYGKNLTARQQNSIQTEVKALLKNQSLAFMFGKGSRAEVNITGTVYIDDQPHNLNGQIDRLIVQGDTVWIVDYKTNATFPKEAKDVPESYVAQMAAYKHVMQTIYPKHTIKSAVLWTRQAVLHELTEAQMQSAAKKMKLGSRKHSGPAKPSYKEPSRF